MWTVDTRRAGVLRVPERTLLRLLPVIAVALAALQAWGSRHFMNPDGVSYVDMADAYLRGDWHAALNSYWNPFYVWILSVGFAVLRPSPYWEFPAVHLINFAIFLGALGSFHFFLVHLIRHEQWRRERLERRTSDGSDELLLRVFGYTVFILFSLDWIGLENVSPDLVVAAFIFLASGLLLRLRMRDSASLGFALGISLGLWYLATVASSLPIILCFVVAAATFGRSHLWRRVAVICLGILIVAAPYVVALSKRQGRFTISDAGKLNYSWYVNAVPRHWNGEMPGLGTPTNPHPRILDVPAAFAYDPSAPGTYPGWFDPARWFDGVTPRLEVTRQLYALKSNAILLFEFVLDSVHAVVIAGVVALFWIRGSLGGAAQAIAQRWFLFAPAILTIAMYSLIWVETRFFGATLALFWLGLLAVSRTDDRTESRPVVRAVILAVAVLTIAGVAGKIAIKAYEDGREPSKDFQVAAFVGQLGLQPGDRVAVIGHVNRCGWARLAGLKITAEIPPESEGDFDAGDEALQRRALDALFGTNVRAVVADHRVETGCATGWKNARGTSFYVCMTAGADRP